MEVDYLLHHFPNIRFGLMVGIGGGAPATPSDDPNKDIRLGDVVVSHSEGNHGGVLRYDTGEIPQRCFFYKPPAILTTAVSELRSRNETVRNAISRHISDMVKSRPTMMGVFQYQGHEHDQLFEADYEHKGGGKGCKICDEERLVHRKLRDTEHPVIHYGVIGSARNEMRHSATRDKLRQEHGILCFETVADGLMLDFPCLFIRGICDYFNTHKNEGWKEYAAATAAAYAKELLQIIPADQVACAMKALRIMKQTSAEVGSTNKDLERLLNGSRSSPSIMQNSLY
ncbi:tetratricopeptide repeat domain protein [Metarhizium guizhouense ARSEF 977]|uniref:Tetratricopeptide repeat domain protein n=1 Tax=Metarhizium guizhouense (strain ARSEF 977) TaxID=1276136 RepID=A0A0B4G8F3_METGA|nr:tetratricopeptide repeat domain protein [Metarhizium guizhouense ARSEF 977]